MIQEYDLVKATSDISEQIKIDTIGVVLSVSDDLKNFVIEFVDKNLDPLEDGMTLTRLDQVILFKKDS